MNTTTEHFRLKVAVTFLLLGDQSMDRSATEIGEDPEMARQVILTLALALVDVRHRAKSQLVTDRPATIEELDDVLHRACAWASELADEDQP